MRAVLVFPSCLGLPCWWGICEPKISKTRQIRKKGQTGGFGDPQNRPDSVFDRNPVSGVGFNMFNVQLRDLN